MKGKIAILIIALAAGAGYLFYNQTSSAKATIQDMEAHFQASGLRVMPPNVSSSEMDYIKDIASNADSSKKDKEDPRQTKSLIVNGISIKITEYGADEYAKAEYDVVSRAKSSGNEYFVNKNLLMVVYHTQTTVDGRGQLSTKRITPDPDEVNKITSAFSSFK